MKKVAATAEKTSGAQWKISDLVDFVQSEFAELADEEKAAPMAAYMKTDMPFYGIQKPLRIPVYSRESFSVTLRRVMSHHQQ